MAILGSLQPTRKFIGIGEDSATCAAWHAIDGKCAFFFPTLDGAFVSSKERSDFLPRVETFFPRERITNG